MNTTGYSSWSAKDAVIQLWYTMHKNEQTSFYLNALGTLNPVI